MIVFKLFTKVAACVVVTALVSSSVAFADTPYVVRVEEDWELVVQTPDPRHGWSASHLRNLAQRACRRLPCHIRTQPPYSAQLWQGWSSTTTLAC